MEAKQITKSVDQKKADLFEQAHRDPELKRLLLQNPQAAAERCGVKLEEDEVEQLKKLGALSEMAEEIIYGRLYPRPPIYYPIHVWEIEELLGIFSTLVTDEMTLTTPAAARNIVAGTGDGGSGLIALHPEWVFYPAKLRNALKDRLMQILQVNQQAIR